MERSAIRGALRPVRPPCIPLRSIRATAAQSSIRRRPVLQMCGCGPREARIVLEVAEPEIAAAAEEAAHLAGVVVMDDARGLREFLLADLAGAVLLGAQG